MKPRRKRHRMRARRWRLEREANGFIELLVTSTVHMPRMTITPFWARWK